MLRLNLTNKPGLQRIEDADEVDLEGLTPDSQVEEESLESAVPTAAKQPESTEQPAEIPTEPESVPPVPEIPDISDESQPVEEFITPPTRGESPVPEIDEDLFKMAEANLDLIEQAEEEETPTAKKAKVVAEKQAAKKKKKHPLIRQAILVGALILLIFVLWMYENGTLSRENMRRTAQKAAERVSQEVSDQADEVARMADNISTQYREQADEIVRKGTDTSQETAEFYQDETESEWTQPPDRSAQAVEQVEGYSAPLAATGEISSRRTSPAQRVQPSSNLPEQVIQRVQVGQNKLLVAAAVLDQFPAGSKLQYLRVKNDKISFILYVRDEQEAERIKNYFITQRRYSPPEVFFVDRNGKVADNPVEIMAIVEFAALSLEDSRGYQYLTDRQLSQYIWQAGLQSRVHMDPLKISNSDVAAVRNGEIAGNGNTSNVIHLLNELAVLRNNMAMTILSIQSDTDQPLGHTTLDYSLNSFIYPGNM
jgi:cytoskeletal protein RodZ